MISQLNQYDLSRLYTISEAAQEMGLAMSSVASMVSRGTLKTQETRFGKLITDDSVNEYKEKSLGKPGRRAKL